MAESASSRAKNALLGALVADAATMPLHWIYSEEKITAAMGDKADKPEFFNPPSCPYYSTEAHPGHYTLGQVSPYGEEMLALTGHLTKNGGDFKSGEAFADDLLAWAETYKGRPNSGTKKFVEQRKEGKKYPECGADDSQANSLVKSVVVTARYYGRPELYDKVEEAIRTHQDNDLAVLYGQAAARILERVILGESIQQVLTKLDDGMDEEVSGAIKFAVENKSKPTWEFITLLGERVKLQPVYATSCALPGAFILPLYLLANHSTFEDGLRANIRIGGDNCSRSMFLGAILAAAGTGSIPSDWKAKVKDLAEYEKMADVIVKART